MQALGSATTGFGMNHSWCRIRHTHNEHPEVNERDHHGDTGRFLATMRRSGCGEYTRWLAFHCSREPEINRGVDERFHLRCHVAVARGRTHQQAIRFPQVIQSADGNVLLILPNLRCIPVAPFEFFFDMRKFRGAAEK